MHASVQPAGGEDLSAGASFLMLQRDHLKVVAAWNTKN